MKTNAMIMAVAISAGVAEGLKKRMEIENQQVVKEEQQPVVEQQDFSETAKQYATNVFESYGDYWKNWQKYLTSGQYTNAFAQVSCPVNMRVLLKKTIQGKDNYIVLVGEKHGEDRDQYGNIVGDAQEPFAEKFVTEMKKDAEGVRRIAAIELPILESEDKPQLVKNEKDAPCKQRVRKGMKWVVNCEVPAEFENERATVPGAKTVIGSGAGRIVGQVSQREDGKFNVPWCSMDDPNCKKNADLASINHSVFSLNAAGAGVEIKGGEPAHAVLESGDVGVNRNDNAAARLNALAAEEQDRSTVVTFSYGAFHLCNIKTPVQSHLVETHGWQIVNPDYQMSFNVSEIGLPQQLNVANHGAQQIGGYQQHQIGGYQHQIGGYQQQFGGYEAQLARALEQSMMQNQPQGFPEKDIEQVMTFLGNKITKDQAVQLLKQYGGNVNNAIMGYINPM